MKKTILSGAIILPLTLLLMFPGCSQVRNRQSGTSSDNVSDGTPHIEKQGTAARLVVDGNPLLMLSGELHNSTAGGFSYMRPVWKRMAGKNLNTVIASVSWELIEPEEGNFDFSLVDSVITGAREANLKVVLIWFASWKNGASTYMPSWVKKNYARYPRAIDETGKPLEILSTFGTATAEADSKAFAALMSHIRDEDSMDHTVVMMQLENEVGLLDNNGKTPGNARRDFRENATKAYNSNVPEELMKYLSVHKDNLFPELLKVWEKNGFKASGTWEEVFGKSEFKPEQKDWQFYSFYTEELFMAWNYASYIEKVAAAGKKEYSIPMYVNAWLKQPSCAWPGRYPGGGPLPQVHDMYRAAAPSIDFLSPDIYVDYFQQVCEEFTRGSNPLFIPETQGGALGAMRAFYAIGEFQAGLFAPFGIDNQRFMENDPLDESYAVLQNMSPVILENQGKGTMKGFLVSSAAPTQKIELGNYSIEARFTGRDRSPAGGALIICTGPDEYVVAGRALDLFFTPKDESIRIGIDAEDEGTFDGLTWVPERRLNGDETHASTWDGTGIRLTGDKVCLQKVSLYQYK